MLLLRFVIFLFSLTCSTFSQLSFLVVVNVLSDAVYCFLPTLLISGHCYCSTEVLFISPFLVLIIVIASWLCDINLLYRYIAMQLFMASCVLASIFFFICLFYLLTSLDLTYITNQWLSVLAQTIGRDLRDLVIKSRLV